MQATATKVAAARKPKAPHCPAIRWNFWNDSRRVYYARSTIVKKTPANRRISGGGAYKGIAIMGGCGNIPMWTRLDDYINTYLIDKPTIYAGGEAKEPENLGDDDTCECKSPP